jgi:hypothetical protein
MEAKQAWPLARGSALVERDAKYTGNIVLSILVVRFAEDWSFLHDCAANSVNKVQLASHPFYGLAKLDETTGNWYFVKSFKFASTDAFDKKDGKHAEWYQTAKAYLDDHDDFARGLVDGYVRRWHNAPGGDGLQRFYSKLNSDFEQKMKVHEDLASSDDEDDDSEDGSPAAAAAGQYVPASNRVSKCQGQL